MTNFICQTCGVQYTDQGEQPSCCVICEEERQYVLPSGQNWTTLEEMQNSNLYNNNIVKEEKGLYSLTTNPTFAIGQTAYLVQHNGFNVLWDCITYMDDETISKIKNLGGIDAIAVSHPHFYSTIVEWAKIFDVPVYLHEDDRQWVIRPHENLHFWSGEEFSLKEGLTLYRLGGHFKGGSVLHWSEGNEGKGSLLSGDIIQVVADQNWVSFMYSYPNLIPLPIKKVEEIAEKVKLIPFNRLYNAFHRKIFNNANQAVQKSATRYIKALEGELFQT
ncbi:hypothetical protein HNQ94_000837 [Salirhabdus euzebyi]|uniref:Metallo-beta-lactamase domain-containing protein n=1 Tax=Salirhabdus euzebyi TaxID=394506 RepID=A0A841Q212_9BACI|nr:MBL fold metallo-hydrolase [Salirhabdus euzebyi]MBB6452392.1 hypothetical protein [Salirhabdus euzebyi]